MAPTSGRACPAEIMAGQALPDKNRFPKSGFARQRLIVPPVVFTSARLIDPWWMLLLRTI